MLRNIYIRQLFILLVILINTSCEDFVEIETPKHKIVSATVFAEDETAISAMTGIYNELFNADFSGGWRSSVSVLSGLSSDVLEPVNSNSVSNAEFNQNEISPNNDYNFNLWSSTFNIIYMTNALLEGLSNSEGVSEEVSLRLEGEASFIRAFSYFYLVNLYGDVPIILSTDYEQNSLVTRNNREAVYELIIEDLEASIVFLDSHTESEDRTRVNKFVATAMLARVYLFMEDWEKAEILSNQVLAETSKYEILENLDEVFLPNSKEAIWQISPIGGNVLTNTNEGSVYIGTSRSSIKLSDQFVSSFSLEDKRLDQWVGFYSDTNRAFHFPFKYKDRSSTNNITEYSMVLRLAEQFFIRAEARARTGNLSGAIADLDEIRSRSNLETISESNPGIGQEQLLELIQEERKKELFSEWGHRWLDLKRTNRASEILSPFTSWEDTDVLYPIPEEDRMKNPNLTQNDGY
ncbi:RagB/SusD domain-containing protein [Salegentibacter agarivorans]|uniref:RagB/SusD domain-containing protein n=1 Tax=Salegentibacter agarivorans TaxID=345907 RepID=A0A1I2KR70_9FLAO|nr:RagB/SusD family nutrient uptake outer membrane protein [Salegentibacter agarivorans]SFF68819.1 RagB/SusD domain-containing protein [Salegentibacter agarivorans]